MRIILILLLCAILPACVGARTSVSDPIAAQTQKLNATNGMWINGLYPIINLPANAQPDEVLAQAIKQTGFDQGHIRTYEIQEVRQVQLDSEIYSAALVQTDLGTKVFLFKPQRDNCWWTRFYDVE